MKLGTSRLSGSSVTWCGLTELLASLQTCILPYTYRKADFEKVFFASFSYLSYNTFQSLSHLVFALFSQQQQKKNALMVGKVETLRLNPISG